jgi:GxxExxY protein
MIESENFLHSGLSEQIIKCFYKVYKVLGYGFLEKVYHNALLIELRSFGLDCKSLSPLKVYYNQKQVGFYITDLIINDCIIVEIKAAEVLNEAHEAQLTNYLRATDIEVGLLLNFGKKPAVRRKIFSSRFKTLS